MPCSLRAGTQVPHGRWCLIRSSASSGSQAFSTVRLVFCGLGIGANYRLRDHM